MDRSVSLADAARRKRAPCSPLPTGAWALPLWCKALSPRGEGWGEGAFLLLCGLGKAYKNIPLTWKINDLAKIVAKSLIFLPLPRGERAKLAPMPHGRGGASALGKSIICPLKIFGKSPPRYLGAYLTGHWPGRKAVVHRRRSFVGGALPARRRLAVDLDLLGMGRCDHRAVITFDPAANAQALAF